MANRFKNKRSESVITQRPPEITSSKGNLAGAANGQRARNGSIVSNGQSSVKAKGTKYSSQPIQYVLPYAKNASALNFQSNPTGGSQYDSQGSVGIQEFSPHPQNLQMAGLSNVISAGGNIISGNYTPQQLNLMEKNNSIGDYVAMNAMHQQQPQNSRQKGQLNSQGQTVQYGNPQAFSNRVNGSITKTTAAGDGSSLDGHSKTPQAVGYSGGNRNNHLDSDFNSNTSAAEKGGQYSTQMQAQVQNKQSRGGTRRAINLQQVYAVNPDAVMDQARAHSTMNTPLDNTNFKVQYNQNQVQQMAKATKMRPNSKAM